MARTSSAESLASAIAAAASELMMMMLLHELRAGVASSELAAFIGGRRAGHYCARRGTGAVARSAATAHVEPVGLAVLDALACCHGAKDRRSGV